MTVGIDRSGDLGDLNESECKALCRMVLKAGWTPHEETLRIFPVDGKDEFRQQMMEVFVPLTTLFCTG
jgi:hypothetical protein